MKEFKYKVSLQSEEGSDGQEPQSITLDFTNHDDVFKIIRMAKESGGALSEDTEQFVIGLKLLTDVCMKRRKEPFFAQLQPLIKELMTLVKADVKGKSAGQDK